MEGYERFNHSQEPLSLREEFRWKRFGLNHGSPFDFLRSQWQSTPKSVCFLVYRCLLGASFGIATVTYTVIYYKGGHCFIYLTNWGFFMCGITSVMAAILQIVYHCKNQSWVPPSCVIKSYWAIYWINLCVSNVVALAYWTFIYPADRVPTNPTYITDFWNIWTHALPPILFTVDHFVVAQPARLLHFVYPLGFALVYVGFTIVFYFAGGRDLNGRRYIYKILDYSKPKKSSLLVMGIMSLLVACSTLQYGVYRLRALMARKLGKLIS